jgi:hypothetical protein
LGFPISPDKWKVSVNVTSANITSIVAGTYYNVGSQSITVPIGMWQPILSAGIFCTFTTVAEIIWGLSTTNSASPSICTRDEQPPYGGYLAVGAGSTVIHPLVLILASKTTYYLNIGLTSGGASFLGFYGGVMKFMNLGY